MNVLGEAVSYRPLMGPKVISETLTGENLTSKTAALASIYPRERKMLPLGRHLWMFQVILTVEGSGRRRDEIDWVF
jgi:hypothetical protein